MEPSRSDFAYVEVDIICYRGKQMLGTMTFKDKDPSELMNILLSTLAAITPTHRF